MEQSKHNQAYKERQFKLKALRKAKVAREVFKLGVNRVKDMVHNKDKLSQFKSSLAQKDQQKK